MRRLLYDTASSYGVKIRMNTRVRDIDPDTPCVTLDSGEVLYADVIVGADGVSGLARKMITDDDGDGEPGALNMYWYIPSQTHSTSPAD